MKIGTSEISNLYLGNSEIQKVYLGTNSVYEKGGGAIGGIDANTMIMLHLDDNLNDSSLYSSTFSITSTATPTYGAGKFDKALDIASNATYNANYKQSTNFNFTSNTQITLDWWMYVPTYTGSSSAQCMATFTSSNGYTYNFGVSYTNNVWYLGANEATTSTYISSKVNYDAWNHFAVQSYFRNDNGYLAMACFVNGEPATYWAPKQSTARLSSFSSVYLNSYGQNFKFDEIRLSNIGRYNLNNSFTPNDGPYTLEQ